MSATGLMENEGNRPGRLSVLTMSMGMQVTMSDDSSRTERIRQQAYLMWLEEGRPEGGDAGAGDVPWRRGGRGGQLGGRLG